MSQIAIRTVTSEADLASARTLFEEYGLFLRATQACGSHFRYASFQAEVLGLPSPYTELILALVDGSPAGCVAYREGPQKRTCEIKRLFVLPAFRGHGLARQLVEEVLQRLVKSGCARVILDTDLTNMVHAHALYLALGFREYKPRDHSLAYLELAIRPAPGPEPVAACGGR